MPGLKQSLQRLLKQIRYLPHHSQRSTLIELEPMGYASAKPGNKVLVIEEERNLCLLIKIFLSRKNFEVQVAQNGADGIAYATTSNPDTIWVSSNLTAQDPQLLFKLRAAAPKARIAEKADIIKFMNPARDNNGAKIE